METLLDGKVILHCGDCIETLAAMDENSVDSIVTDPPYHLTSIVKRFGKPGSAEAKSDGATGVYRRASAGFMGKVWDGGDIAFQSATWKLALNVLKPGGHLLAFGAPKNFGRMQVAIEDAGFEIRDVIAWLFGSGFPKSHDVSKGIDRAAGAKREVIGSHFRHGGGQERSGSMAGPLGTASMLPLTAPATEAAAQWSGWGTALKPAYEPIILARKPLIGTVAMNVLEHGTGAINVDACRVATDVPRPARDRFKDVALDATRNTYGAGLNGSRAVDDTNIGRWPANVAHDGSDEVMTAFPITKSGLLKAGTIRNHANKIYGEGMSAAGKPATTYDQGGDSGSAARFFYCAKANKSERIGSKHPTVKPIALMRWLVRMVTPPGGTVLDPFAGTGTTAEAALLEGFKAVLIEKEADSQEDIRRRMALLMMGPEEHERAMTLIRNEVRPANELPLFERLAA